MANNRRWLSAAAFAGMFVFGIVMAVLGAAMPVLAGRLRFELGQAGNLFFAMNLCHFAALLAVGPLSDRYGKKPALAGGALAVAAALATMAGAG